MGIELLTDGAYRELQELGEFDTTTSSWVVTPPEIRKLGGALFCDLRHGAVSVYHDGAESYYAARGFRGALEVCAGLGARGSTRRLTWRPSRRRGGTEIEGLDRRRLEEALRHAALRRICRC